MGTSEIIRLSQEEGLYDHEIAMLLGVHRTTVVRTRKKFEVPKASLGNRKDKVAICSSCGSSFLIRRKQTRRKCFSCAPLVNGEDLCIKGVKKWTEKTSAQQVPH